MRVRLPCKLGERFEIPAESYRRGWYTLMGFDRAMQHERGYTDPSIWAYKDGYVDMCFFRMEDFDELPYEVELPDHLLELHPLEQHGIRSKQQVELIGMVCYDGKITFDFIFPRNYYSHEKYECPDLEKYVESIKTDIVVPHRYPIWMKPPDSIDQDELDVPPSDEPTADSPIGEEEEAPAPAEPEMAPPVAVEPEAIEEPGPLDWQDVGYDDEEWEQMEL